LLVDYNTETFPNIPKNEIAELLYFGHQGEPFGDIRIPSLKNKYLYYAHDDGWILRLYYKKWDDIVKLIDSIEFCFDKKKLIHLYPVVRRDIGDILRIYGLPNSKYLVSG
jgi:hypothetical protein